MLWGNLRLYAVFLTDFLFDSEHIHSLNFWIEFVKDIDLLVFLETNKKNIIQSCLSNAAKPFESQMYFFDSLHFRCNLQYVGK